MSKRYSISLLVLVFVLPMAVHAQWDCETNGNAITIIKYTGTAGVVKIPEKINDLTVTRVENFAFASCTNLTSVTIPKSVTSIGMNAFLFCASLKKVCFLGNAPSLGEDVFFGASKVIVYYLPETTGWGVTFGGRSTVRWQEKEKVEVVRCGTK